MFPVDLVIQDLEVLETLDFDIRFFYRYVDDIVIVVSTTMINAMLDKFNLLHPRLQFILEVGTDRINFLDSTIIISNNIKFDWIDIKNQHFRENI